MVKTKYNYSLLQKYCKENSLELLKDYSNENINCEILIIGKCSGEYCSNIFEKKFLYIITKGGSFCKDCIKINRVKNMKKTNLTIYGVENPMQNKELREKVKQTNLDKYGVEYLMQNKELREKAKQTNLVRYGSEYLMQNKELREKAKQTNLVKYGAEYLMQNKELNEKAKQTNLIRYGAENPNKNKDVREKIKKTNLEKYGCISPAQNKDIVNKIKQTNLIRYGYESSAHNPEISEKASKRSYKLKEYILPSGNTIHLQGYEKFGIDDLLKKEQINENDIITSRIEVPEVWYNDPSGKKRRYYVDFYIPSQNRCIEVKSKWTMEKKKDVVFLKQNAVRENGFLCDLWVYNKKGEIIECYK